MRHWKVVSLVLFAFTIALAPRTASASTIYFQGFETDASGWSNTTRVASGTGGVPSADGSFHGQVTNGGFSQLGGYNFGAGNAVPTLFQEFTTSISIYLDVNAGWANDSRFDMDSAINNSGGTFLRDFIFNCGGYKSTDLTGPGAGTDRFVCSTSNNSQPGSAFAKNPARDPYAISNTGWYDFQTRFYNNGGFLAADLSIFNSSDVLQHMWTLTTTDAIAGVGGNRYMWNDYSQFTNLAIDNVSLVTATGAAVPEPATFGMMAIGLVGLVAIRRRRRA